MLNIREPLSLSLIVPFLCPPIFCCNGLYSCRLLLPWFLWLRSFLWAFSGSRNWLELGWLWRRGRSWTVLLLTYLYCRVGFIPYAGTLLLSALNLLALCIGVMFKLGLFSEIVEGFLETNSLDLGPVCNWPWDILGNLITFFFLI